MSDAHIPADQLMLLRLIDAKFETMSAKVDGLQKSITILTDHFDKYDAKFTDHEKRIKEIEGEMAVRKLQVREFEDLKTTVHGLTDWRTEEQTTSKNASKWGGAVWGACGTAVMGALAWFAALYYQAQPAVAPSFQHKTVETTTIPVGEHPTSSGRAGRH